jgi:hypothetical protein
MKTLSTLMACLILAGCADSRFDAGYQYCQQERTAIACSAYPESDFMKEHDACWDAREEWAKKTHHSLEFPASLQTDKKFIKVYPECAEIFPPDNRTTEERIEDMEHDTAKTQVDTLILENTPLP